ncbi:hypothetical protein Tco_0080725, partial [Tanacetum coccineum]
KIASTPIETNKALLKDEEVEDVDVRLYRLMTGSLMYLTTSRPDIMFAVCACARFQVTPKVSHLHAVKRIFRYLKGDEGRPNINELMAICTNLSNRVLALETSKTAQDLVIKKLKKKVKSLEKNQRARTPGMKLFKIGTSRRKSLDKENVSNQGRNLKIRQMFEEGDFDDDFDDIDDMVNEAIDNVERETVNTATTRVSAAIASVTTTGVSISTAEPRIPPTTATTVFEDDDL